MVLIPRTDIFSSEDQQEVGHIAFSSCTHQLPHICFGDVCVEQWQRYASHATNTCKSGICIDILAIYCKVKVGYQSILVFC